MALGDRLVRPTAEDAYQKPRLILIPFFQREAPAMTEIAGIAPQRFARVKDAFAALFAQGLELGARFAVAVDGEVVVDLMGGFADRATTRPVAADTLTPVFSTTKAVMALMVARLVEAREGSATTSRSPRCGRSSARRARPRSPSAQALSHQAGLRASRSRRTRRSGSTGRRSAGAGGQGAAVAAGDRLAATTR